MINDINEIKCQNDNSIYNKCLYCIRNTLFYMILFFIVFFGSGVWYIIFFVDKSDIPHNNTHNYSI